VKDKPLTVLIREKSEEMDRGTFKQSRWRQVAMFVLTLTLSLTVFAGCAATTQHAKAPQTTPGITTFGPTPISYAPGQFQVLNGYHLSLAVSATQHGRVVGCMLPVGSNTEGAPHFVISDDGGLHWRIHAIPGVQAIEGCLILADTMRSDSFVLADGDTFITTAAGKSWRAITTPCGSDVNPVALVNGRLLAGICSHGGDLSLSRLAITTLTPNGKQANGAWVTVNTDPLNVKIGGNTLEGYASDFQDIAHIYALVSTGPFGMTLYATTNSGASWRNLRSWPDVNRMALWTATHGQVFVQDVSDKGGSTTQFFYSSDSGATWQDSGLHQRNGAYVFVSPQGKVIEDVLLSGETGNLFQLDPRTGVFTLLTNISFANAYGGGFSLTIVDDGAHSTVLYTDLSQTAVIPVALK
jgi:hypothetical protein